MTSLARKLDRPATYADLETLPEGVKAEIIDGTIVTQPTPLPEHSEAAGGLRVELAPLHGDGRGGGPGGWWILLDVDVQISTDKVVRPDVAGWRRERLPNPRGVRPIHTVPDWICEIISPSNAAHDRVTKRTLYASAGVAYYWLVDPAERVLEALELRDGRWIEIGSYDDTAVARIAPFEAIELGVGRLFLPSSPEPGNEG